VSVEALVFDVFGTVVDWRSSAVRAVEATGLSGDPGAFADAWRREGYLHPLVEVVTGQRPWEPMERLMRATLDDLAVRFGVRGDLDALQGVWRALDPWPDAVEGLARLKARLTVSTLSNGGFAQLTAIGKHAGLPWDCVISTDLFRAFKPDPACYLGACELLELPPSSVALVAAHPADLRGAAGCGLRTAYVPRPLEWGPDGPQPEVTDEFDWCAPDFLALADELDVGDVL
jgi:2-haloacid dehalogenase